MKLFGAGLMIGRRLFDAWCQFEEIQNSAYLPTWRFVNMLNISSVIIVFLGISGFDSTTRDSYFTWSFHEPYFSRKHVFHHREWTDHKNMFLKPANKYQILWQHHIPSNILLADFQHHLFLCWAKVLWT